MTLWTPLESSLGFSGLEEVSEEAKKDLPAADNYLEMNTIFIRWSIRVRRQHLEQLFRSRLAMILISQ